MLYLHMRHICYTDFLHAGRLPRGVVSLNAEHFLGRDLAITTYPDKHPAGRWCPKALRPRPSNNRGSRLHTFSSRYIIMIWHRLWHELYIASNWGKLLIVLEVACLDYACKFAACDSSECLHWCILLSGCKPADYCARTSNYVHLALSLRAPNSFQAIVSDAPCSTAKRYHQDAEVFGPVTQSSESPTVR